MAGGYQSLNLKGLNFGLNSTAQTVEGIWDVYEGSYGKPILITNYSIAGVEQKERYVNFSVVSTFVQGVVYQIVGSNSITTVQMSITQDDKVQFTSTTNNTTEG
jgi:hypothetical protein